MIWDLWETLVDFDAAHAGEMVAGIAARLGEQPESFRRRWDAVGHRRYVGPIRDALRGIGVPEDALEDVCALRLDYNRRALVPRPGAVETLRELHRRGLRLGLISICSEEVELLWPETAFAGLFDAAVFSCTAGLSKPDPRAYLACCAQLGVEPAEALFVGDGANDELAGAERAGLRAVQIHRPGEPGGWRGERIESVPQILELVPKEAPC